MTFFLIPDVYKFLVFRISIETGNVGIRIGLQPELANRKINRPIVPMDFKGMFNVGTK